MNIIRKNFDYIGTPLLAGMFGLLFLLESKYQLRKRVQSRWSRIKINAAVATPSFILLRLMFVPAMVYLAQRSGRVRKIMGLVIPSAVLRQVIGFLLLDYSNYLWHILNHKIPFLWRFHLVHHTDKDLDITTAFRFHFGEMIGSLFYRGACTYLSGATPLTVIVYEIVLKVLPNFITAIPGYLYNWSKH